jgi:small subunit ribosomal protein S21
LFKISSGQKKTLHLPSLKKIKMLIVQLKEGDTLEKALKKFKKKFEKTGVVKELRERQKFTKKSIKRRQGMIKAVYKNRLQQGLLED